MCNLIMILLLFLLLIGVFITLHFTLTNNVSSDDEFTGNSILEIINDEATTSGEFFNFGIGFAPITRDLESLVSQQSDSKKFNLIAKKSVKKGKYNISILAKAQANSLDEKFDYQPIDNFNFNNFSEVLSPTGMENPRLFTYNNKQFVICDFRGKNLKVPSDLLFSKYEKYYTLDSHKIIFFPFDDVYDIKILIFEDALLQSGKEWMPFESEGVLYIVYSIYPEHVILKVNDLGICQKVYSTSYTFPRSVSTFEETNPLPISFEKDGIINGAPPIKYFFNNEEYFLGLAHTQHNGKNFFMKNLFYLFEPHPPFAIKTITSEFHLSPEKYKIEFGNGILVNDGKVLISYLIDNTSPSFVILPFERIDKHLSINEKSDI